eukprot:GHVR01136346.1.p1 GENE.GHVR01136346.1~~GHVR01136346.1.p1  ORF type:complete len:111 (+),score=3.67 GHVR01136346.1:128-460(+)
MTLHLATTSMVGCGFMVKDEVPPDIVSLLQGQSLLVEDQLAFLLASFANVTLRQSDILLKDIKLPDRERESLRKLPLFEKDLFPVDFQAHHMCGRYFVFFMLSKNIRMRS